MIDGIDLARDLPPAAELAPAHFVGVGGAGMSGVARLWLAAGLAVSGSDARDSPVLAALGRAGARVHVGHRAEQVTGARSVVVSSAVREDNPEVIRARELGLPLVHRAQALAGIAAGRRVVAVAGTNGKTTSTGLVTVLARECGLDPSYSIGGDLRPATAATAGDTNAHLGSGATFVLEADESDGTFVVYRPQVALVTNVQPDHLDFYGTPAGVRAGFQGFVDTVRPGGVLVACADDAGSRSLAAHSAAGDAVVGDAVAGDAVAGGLAVTTYGESADADVRLDGWHPDGTGSTFDVTVRGEPAGRARLLVPGRHNALNALGAVGVLEALGVPPRDAVAALVAFTGTRRRFEPRGERAGIRVYDDYAHNPGKVAAALATGRQVAGAGRLVVAFQPHLYSRTRDFAVEFGQALGQADEVVVLDVYPAREDPIPGVSGELVAAQVPLPPDRVGYVPEWGDVADRVVARLRPGDLLLTVGAGDVTRLPDEVLARLAGRP